MKHRTMDQRNVLKYHVKYANGSHLTYMQQDDPKDAVAKILRTDAAPFFTLPLSPSAFRLQPFPLLLLLLVRYARGAHLCQRRIDIA